MQDDDVDVMATIGKKSGHNVLKNTHTENALKKRHIWSQADHRGTRHPLTSTVGSTAQCNRSTPEALGAR